MNTRLLSVLPSSALVIVFACLTIGCTPSLQAKSAGQVGCLPDEVTISDEKGSLAWGQSIQTWVAKCHGQRFVCSETTNAGTSVAASNGQGSFVSASGGDTTETHCTSMRKSRKADAGDNSNVSANADERPNAPRGGAGFDFGINAATAQTTCEKALKRWTAAGNRRYLCSASPVDLGFPAEVVLDTCQGTLCSVTVERRTNTNWIATFGELKGQLESKYGPAKQRKQDIPPDCRADSAIERCIDTDTLHLHYSWIWPNGVQMNLFLNKDESTARTLAIRLQYLKSPYAIRTQNDTL